MTDFEVISGAWTKQVDGSYRGVVDASLSARCISGTETDENIEFYASVKITTGKAAVLCNFTYDVDWNERYIEMILDPTGDTVKLEAVTRDSSGIETERITLASRNMALATGTTYNLRLASKKLSDGSYAVYGYIDDFLVVEAEDLATNYQKGMHGLESLGVDTNYSEYSSLFSGPYGSRGFYSSITDIMNVLGIQSSQWASSGYPTENQVNDMQNRADAFIDAVCGHDWNLHAAVVEEYDGIGYGPRAGVIILKHKPVLAVSLVEYWDGVQWKNDTFEGHPSEYPTKQCYYFYPEQAKILFSRLRLDGPHVYRVTYDYGYTAPPDFIRDLSATLTAIDVIGYMAKGVHASFSLSDLSVSYPAGFEYGAAHRMLIDKAHRLLWQAASRRPIGETG